MFETLILDGGASFLLSFPQYAAGGTSETAGRAVNGSPASKSELLRIIPAGEWYLDVFPLARIIAKTRLSVSRVGDSVILEPEAS